MTWFIWRQHRVEAACAALACVAAAAVLLYSTEQVDSVRRSLTTAAQSVALIAFGDRVGVTMTAISFVLFALPAVAGIFVGAPMFSRYFEHGTHRLILTQSITRRKWFWMTVAFMLGPAAVMSAGLAVLATRWSEAQGPLSNQWYQFDEQGLALVAYVIFALSVGLALGILIRRTVPAMAATAIVFVAVRAIVAIFVRPELQPPIRISQDAAIPDGSWVFSTTAYTDTLGRTVTSEQVNKALQNAGPIPGTVADYLHGLGINSWVYYQPADRFWVFQAEEAILFLILAALLVGMAGLVVQRWSD